MSDLNDANILSNAEQEERQRGRVMTHAVAMTERAEAAEAEVKRLLAALSEAEAEATTLRKTLDRQREETVKGSERADRAESQFQEARERLRLANIDVFNTEAEVASLTAIRERAEAARAVHAKSPTFTSGLIVLVLDAILDAAPSPEAEEADSSTRLGYRTYEACDECRKLDKSCPHAPAPSPEPPPEGVAKWAPIENERELERLRAIEGRAQAVLGLIDPRTVNEYGRGQYAAACAILAVDGPPEPRYDNDAILMQDNDAILAAAPAPKEERRDP